MLLQLGNCSRLLCSACTRSPGTCRHCCCMYRVCAPCQHSQVHAAMYVWHCNRYVDVHRHVVRVAAVWRLLRYLLYAQGLCSMPKRPGAACSICLTVAAHQTRHAKLFQLIVQLRVLRLCRLHSSRCLLSVLTGCTGLLVAQGLCNSQVEPACRG